MKKAASRRLGRAGVSARPSQRVRAKRGPMTGSGGDPAQKLDSRFREKERREFREPAEAYAPENFSSLIASKSCTPPPTRLVV